MHRIAIFSLAGVALLSLALGGSAQAYTQYSINKDPTNCRLCHGDFRAPTYLSLSDGGTWVDGLHITHRDTMLGGDCNVCHSAGPPFPVLLGSSAGGANLADAISCSGCHGRALDGTGSGSVGYGAGLRQHHWVAGVQTCGTCHSDANPSNFTPVDEHILPPYYDDSDYPDIPGDPCNLASEGFPEDYASTTLGLDNDGDDVYDGAEVIACPEPRGSLLLSSGIGFLMLIGRRRAAQR